MNLRKMLPSSNALFVFEAAAREGSFTKAATELNVTQPAVSRMLGRLERHLGARLFQRGGDGVSLTEDGLVLFHSIRSGFRGIEVALEEIRRRTTGLEMVTLSVSSGFATHWLMPRIGALQKACPNVDLRFQLISGALRGPVDAVDLGMRFIGAGDTQLETSFLVNEVIFPVCSPAYLERGRNTGGDTLIHLADGSMDWIDRLRANGTIIDAQHDMLQFPDYAVVLQAALLGQGIALGWISVVSHWLKTGALVPVGEPLKTDRRCYLASPKSKPLRDATCAVRDWLLVEMRRDLDEVDARYPHLGIKAASFSPHLRAGASTIRAP